MPWFENIAEFIAAYRNFAYLLVFVMAFWESIPVIGFFVPGSTLIVGAAILVPAGALDLGPVLILAGLGAVAGDVVSFGMGAPCWAGGRWPAGRRLSNAPSGFSATMAARPY
jgi:membrane protein DedA with SNARE-associated domain